MSVGRGRARPIFEQLKDHHLECLSRINSAPSAVGELLAHWQTTHSPKFLSRLFIEYEPYLDQAAIAIYRENIENAWLRHHDEDDDCDLSDCRFLNQLQTQMTVPSLKHYSYR